MGAPVPLFRVDSLTDNGNDIYAEARGLLAGYRWPQYSLHRGQLQMLSYKAVLERLGPEAVRLGHRITGYRNHDHGVTALVETQDGRRLEAEGSALSDLAARSAHGPCHHQLDRRDHRQRNGWTQGDWNRRVALDDFAHHFDGWNCGWLDVPAMLRGADEIFEYPMIDRDPVPIWVDGRVVLMGDAAHVMTGLVDDRCGGVFDDIDEVIPAAEREAFMARYKAAAGFAIETLNAAPSTIAPGARASAQ